MKIKKIEINGFKSFAEKTSFIFGKGITTIVGPNGCGKSNIIDAFRWVLGEQSAKHLRGGNMSDVIFSGSEKKNSMSFAEVSITFINDSSKLVKEYANFSEIEVTRRIYKTGDSEYEINRHACRLRDIVDLFLGTGIGTRAYSIIEQGQVNKIINAKPDERRQIIEEASGITKYKAKRNAAQKKMQETQQNLLRLNDIVGELEMRMNTLKRQSQKAKKFIELQDQLKNIYLHNCSLSYLRNKAQQSFVMNKHSYLTRSIDDLMSEIAKKESTIQKQRDGLQDRQKCIESEQEHIHQLEKTASLYGQDISFAKNKINSNKNHCLQIKTELSKISEKEDLLLNSLSVLQKDKKNIDLKVAMTDQNLTHAEEELKEQTIEKNKMVIMVNNQQKLVQKQKNSSLQYQLEATSLSQQKLDLKNLLDGALRKQQNIFDDEQSVDNQISKADSDYKEVIEQVKSINKDLSILDESIKNNKVDLREINSQIEDKKNFQTKISSRLESIKEIDDNNYDCNSSVQKILKKSQGHIAGLLADFIQVDKKYEKTVENLLHDKLEAVIVKNNCDFDNFIAQLLDKNTGAAWLLKEIDNLSNSKVNNIGINITFGLPLIKFITVTNGKINNVVNKLFNRTIVVENHDVARQNHDKCAQNDITMITVDGSIYHPCGLVYAGKDSKNSYSLLQRKREIKELSQEVITGQKQLNEICLKAEKIKTILHEKYKEQNHKKQLLQIKDIAALRLQEKLKHLYKEQRRLREELQSLEKELSFAKIKFATIDEEINKNNKLKCDTLKQLESAQDKLQSQQELLKDFEDKYIIKNELTTKMRIESVSNLEKQKSLHQSIDFNKQNSLELQQRDKNLQSQLSKIMKDTDTNVQHIVDKEKKISSINSELQQLSDKNLLEKNSLEREVINLKDQDVALKEKRNNYEKLRGELNKFEISLKEIELEINGIDSRLREQYGLSLAKVVVDFHKLPIPRENLQNSIEQLQKRIKQIGTINTEAIKEFEEIGVRYNFLSEQRDDLQTASLQLKNAIDKINQTTKKRFKESFTAINEHFQEVFPRLFRGGEAWLKLSDPDDLLNSGVEIFAQPPGKKLGSIILLSGGEKALTAISLIFAIFLIKPSPFCILDEVDAPLDDANVDRFGDMLKEMSKISQFIVITHNRQTMTKADSLYGITMQDAGISKAVNVKFDNSCEDTLPSNKESSVSLQP